MPIPPSESTTPERDWPMRPMAQLMMPTSAKLSPKPSNRRPAMSVTYAAYAFDCGSAANIQIDPAAE